jgi:cytochrome c-type biogenesis protein CcmH/NrfG
MRLNEKRYAPLIYVILAAAILAVYWQVGGFDFLDYDDQVYVSENPNVRAGINAKSVIWAFTTPGIGISYWHPVTWLSHMLDCQLFGLNPRWHHLSGLLFHIANSLLLFWVLKYMTGLIWPSAFVAAVFALHPLNVESVAWIAERKNLLSMLFWLLTMGAYGRYVKHPTTGQYLLTLAAFSLGLMAKPMVVTLPFVLLLLDFWPLGRFRWKALPRLLWEKVPFFALSAVISIATFLVQHRGASVSPLGGLSLQVRICNALVSYVDYIVKMFWPVHLAVIYPFPEPITAPLWKAVGAAVFLVCITIRVLREAERRGYLTVGWLWYLGTLIPVIGLVQVGKQLRADRYTYIPLIGLFIIISWFMAEFIGKRKYGRAVLAVSAAAVLSALSLCTFRQLQYWRNNETLFAHATEVTENNYIALGALGMALHKQGKVDEAVDKYYQSLKIRPDQDIVHYNLAVAKEHKGDINGAVASWQTAIRINPNYCSAYYALGNLFARYGKLDEAIEYYSMLLKINPDYEDARSRLNKCLAQKGKSKNAAGEH